MTVLLDGGMLYAPDAILRWLDRVRYVLENAYDRPWRVRPLFYSPSNHTDRYGLCRNVREWVNLEPSPAGRVTRYCWRYGVTDLTPAAAAGHRGREYVCPEFVPADPTEAGRQLVFFLGSVAE